MEAAKSLDPALRYRALYNLGLVGLLASAADTSRREELLDDAADRLRQALMLQPGSARAKWNLELVNRMRSSGGGQSNKPNPPPPPSPGKGGGGAGQPPPQPPRAQGGLSEDQADQVLRSIGQEELRTRRDRTGRTRRAAAAGVKDW